MPNASVMTATRKKAGDFLNVRKLNRTSCLGERVEKISAELFAAFFFESRGASELDPCATLCLGAIQSSAFETVRMQLNVRAKLLLQLIVNPGAAKKSYA